METDNLNIAKILEGKPYGTKLWSPVFGSLSLEEVTVPCVSGSLIAVRKQNVHYFTKEGKYHTGYEDDGAETTLFPSKEMQDWSKLAWKKGDILEDASDNLFPKFLMFERFLDDGYMKFEASRGITTSEKLITHCFQDTLLYTKVENESRVREVKEKIDELLRGKEAANSCDYMLRPFDKVLVRDDEQDYWKPNFFGFKEEDDDFPYITVSGCYAQCIPYNEKTKNLINTNHPYKAEED